MWGFVKNIKKKTVLSITSSGEIGFWEHDIEALKMQGRARGRKGERKTYHINPYHHITVEFGGYLLNVAKKPTRARARKGEAQGVLSYQKATGIFDNPHVCKYMSIQLPACVQSVEAVSNNSICWFFIFWKGESKTRIHQLGWDIPAVQYGTWSSALWNECL